MKTILKTAVLSVCAGLLFMLDVPPEFPPQVEFVSEAHAVLGVRRRAVRRGVIIGSSMAAGSAANAQSQPAAAPAPAPAPAPAASGKSLPLGTVVSSLPAGCTSTPVDGVEYYYCGGNFYKAAFQGNNLVYVTAKP
jgi:hypothetical protein